MVDNDYSLAFNYSFEEGLKYGWHFFVGYCQNII